MIGPESTRRNVLPRTPLLQSGQSSLVAGQRMPPRRTSAETSVRPLGQYLCPFLGPPWLELYRGVWLRPIASPTAVSGTFNSLSRVLCIFRSLLVHYRSTPQYLALDGVYHPISTPISRCATLRTSTLATEKDPNGAITLYGHPFQE